jgi:hypothetical protein
MPTGFDYASSSSASVSAAQRLYAVISSWTINMHQVIVLSDFYYTRTVHDRLPQRQAA